MPSQDDVPWDQLDAEGQIRELIHSHAPLQMQTSWIGNWMTRNGFQPAEVRAAVGALASGVPRQQLSDAVWGRYKAMQQGNDV
jgi:hypothetical protein